MNKKFHFKLLAQLILGAIAANSSSIAHAYDLGVVSTGSGGGQGDSGAASAPYQAPTQGSLVATEPQSIISQQYIQNNMTGAAKYTDMASIAPSVWSISPNGAGGNDNPQLSMRAFQDGSFNVTFDGIPFADGADFTHHVSSYFMAQDTGRVVVDRGPGDASNIGDATFGGTIAVQSKDPASDPTLTPYASAGSFNTHLVGAEFDTGVMQNYGDFSGFIDYKHFSTDGALTNNNMNRGNIFAKFIKPISDNTAITIVAMQNSSHQNASLGATAAEIGTYGHNFGLNPDPTSQAFVGYNFDQFNSDFEYIALKSQQGSWKIDNKLYTFAYAHNAMQGTDPNGDTPNGTVNGATNIPGITSLTQYRSFGDVLRVTDQIGISDLKFGIWVDHQNHESWTNNVDLSLGASMLGVQQAEHSTDTTLQPYLEYVWRPNTDWAITPGLKYNSFNRNYNASFDPNGNGGAGGPLSYSKTWTALLPSLDVHYYMAENWSVYGQMAEGFVAPNLNVFSSPNPALSTSNLQPQKTMNYQLGSVWRSRKLTLSGDVYYITNNNQQQTNIVAGLPLFTNIGKVTYSGIEGESTYYIGTGLSVYGNLSFNNTNSVTTVQDAPKNTAALGVIYNQGPLYASLITKEIGSRFSGIDVNGNPTIHFGSYSVTNFSSTYKIPKLFEWTKNTALQFQVDDLFNRTDMIASAGNTANLGVPLFWTLPGRSYMINLSSDF